MFRLPHGAHGGGQSPIPQFFTPCISQGVWYTHLRAALAMCRHVLLQTCQNRHRVALCARRPTSARIAAGCRRS